MTRELDVTEAYRARLPQQTDLRGARDLAHLRWPAALAIDPSLAFGEGFAIPLAVKRAAAVADPDRWLVRVAPEPAAARVGHAVDALAHPDRFGTSPRAANASIVAFRHTAPGSRV